VDGNSVQVGGACYTLSNVTGSHTVHVTFKLLQYTVSVPCAVPNGSLSPCGEITVDCGDDLELCATPDTCYEVDTWYVDGNSVQVGGACYTLSNVAGSHTVNVTFKLIQYTLTINIVGCGSVTLDPDKVTYDCGETVTLTATPCEGWTFSHTWSGDLTGDTNPQDIVMDGNKTVTATFTLIEPVCGEECDGQTYNWTNAYPWSILWISPWNWDPEPLYGGPGIADTAIIGVGLDPLPPGPILDTDIDICRILGPAHEADGQQTMYVIKDANVLVCHEWDSYPVVPGVGTIIITDDARVHINERHRLANHGTIIEEVSGNADVYVGEDVRGGDNGDGMFELTVTDSANYYVEGVLMIGDDGSGVMTFNGDATVGCAKLQLQVGEDAAVAELNISDNAGLDVFDSGDYGIRIGDGDGIATMNMDGGTVYSATELSIARGDGTATLNMDDGYIEVAGAFEVAAGDDGWALVEHMGGVISCHEFTHAGTNYLYHICGGVLIIDGDVVGDVQGEVDAGRIFACGQESCITAGRFCSRGDIMIDYDNVNPGRTTVWAQSHPGRAWCPTPLNTATDVPTQGTILCWCPGEPNGGVFDQHVFFGTDYEAVANRNLAAFVSQVHPPDNCFDPGCLDLCTTYYWAVDTQDNYTNIIRGEVWSFTTECCRMIESFDQYTTDPWSLIYKAWYDGCGYWDMIDGEPVLISNGNGSCVNLGMENTQDGPKAMIYTYENDLMSLWERDHNYSEATRDFDPALDLGCSNEAALVVYFYGDGENDLTDMWLKLSDGGGTVKSTYGANGEDPANIQIAEWQDWNTKISDLAAIDLSAVTEMSIGFGDDVTNVPDGTTGLMLFDSIQVCGTRCVPQFVTICDLNDDCIVDWKDVKIIGENWLEDRR
jgi:hypothetical protein